MKTFRRFEEAVQHLCNPEDWEQNRYQLKDVRISSYDIVISLLKLGGEITTAIRCAEEVFKISVETPLTEMDVVRLSTRFRLINGILDERIFEKKQSNDGSRDS